LVRRRGEKKLVIELGMLRGQKVRWVLRELEFRPDDPEEERWRTVGLVIGTLVGQAESEGESEPRSGTTMELRRAPVAATAPRDARAPAREWRASLGVDALTGPALERGSWRLGARFGASYRLGLSPVSLHLGLRYQAVPTDSKGMSMDSASAEVGAGVQWDLSRPLNLESTGALLVERVSASATSANTAERDSGARFVPGGLLGPRSTAISFGLFGDFRGRGGDSTGQRDPAARGRPGCRPGPEPELWVRVGNPRSVVLKPRCLPVLPAGYHLPGWLPCLRPKTGPSSG
jgi:hypothetical protein